MSPVDGNQQGSRAMQPSRMFNQSSMQTSELMREVAAMRLAEQATPPTTPRARRYSPVGSLAFTIANWRRLSARRLFAAREDIVVSPSRAPGV